VLAKDVSVTSTGAGAAPSPLADCVFTIVASGTPLCADVYRDQLITPAPAPTPIKEGAAPAPTVAAALESLPIQLQEQKLCEEVMNALIGVQGDYIIAVTPPPPASPSDVKFSLHPSLPRTSLTSLAARFLPLATQHATLTNYTVTHAIYSYGVVNHALASAIDSLLNEFKVSIARAR